MFNHFVALNETIKVVVVVVVIKERTIGFGVQLAPDDHSRSVIRTWQAHRRNPGQMRSAAAACLPAILPENVASPTDMPLL